MSARHLRRLFDLHVGATPAEVARSRRAHFARRLLDDTDLPLAQVATAAGFNSVRQFNRVMKEVFRFTPNDLRARRRAPDRLVADGGLELRMPYRAPLAWAPMLSFLAPRAIPGVEMVDLDAGAYRRVIELAGAPGSERIVFKFGAKPPSSPTAVASCAPTATARARSCSPVGASSWT